MNNAHRQIEPDERTIDNPKSPPGALRTTGRRILLAVVICLLAAVYTLGVIFGSIPTDCRIDASNLMVLGVSVFSAILLVSPDFFQRLRRLKVPGFEVEVEKLRRIQDQQQSELEAMSLLLPLLLNDLETKHLRELSEGGLATFPGSHRLRSDLRHLAVARLIERLPGRKIAEIKDGSSICLSEFVSLTQFGKRMADQLKKLEAARKEEET